MGHCDGASFFQIVPAVVQTARNDLHEIDFRDSFLKIETLAVGLCDDGENNNYYEQVKYGNSIWTTFLFWVKGETTYIRQECRAFLRSGRLLMN